MTADTYDTVFADLAGDLIAAADWDAHPLGAPANWPVTLRHALVMTLRSPVPAVLYWGADAWQFHNGPHAARQIGQSAPAGGTALPGCPCDDPAMRQALAAAWAGTPASVDGVDFLPIHDLQTGARAGLLALWRNDVDARPAVAARGTAPDDGTMPPWMEQEDAVPRATELLGFWRWDVVNDRVSASERFGRLYSVASGQADAPSLSAFLAGIDARDRPRVSRAIARSVESCGDFREEYRLRQSDGRLMWVQAVGHCTAGERGGRAAFFNGVSIDITERKAAEAALRRSQRQMRQLADSMPMLIGILDREERYEFVNAYYAEWFGVDPHAAIGMSARELLGEQAYAARGDAFARAYAGERSSMDARTPHRDGRERIAHLEYLPRRRADGQVDGLYVMVYDKTDQMRIEAALRGSERRLTLALDVAQLGIFEYFQGEARLVWDTRCRKLFGLAADAPVDRALFLARVHPDDVGPHRRIVEALLETAREGAYESNYRIVLPEAGTVRWIAESGRTVRKPDGSLLLLGTVRDITAEQAAAATLQELNESLERRVEARTSELKRQIAEREKIEEALRQAQKMEAIGQLTGGIAHDFNNILAGISGSLELITRLADLGRIAEIGRFADNALTSVQRAAALVQRMLAFSRRQALELQSVDVNDLVRGLEDLLRRTMGETISIELALQPHACCARTDLPQLESVLLNLAINARDAMPDGGRLAIRTERRTRDAHAGGGVDPLPPGEYVVLSVADTGVGMPVSVRQRAFDPFFTTKPTGKGTGLGLSMVYGFARQSGGLATIESEPGAGTTVAVWLPLDARRDGVDQRHPTPSLAHARQGETVLLVEDDSSVRLLVRTVLDELRYTVLEADHPDRALEYLDSTHDIDLLVSDVGLPGMNGRQLAELARQRRPRLPVLFMTGYAENAGLLRGALEQGMDVISKPFSIAAFSDRIQAILAGGGRDVR